MNTVKTAEFLWTKATYSLRSNISRTYFGALWWVLEPLFYLLTFYVVFVVVLKLRDENFIQFLLIGVFFYNWFSKSVSHTANSIIQHQNIIYNFRIPIFLFPAASLMSVLIQQLPAMLTFFIFLICLGIFPTLHWLFIIPLMVLQFNIIFFFSVAFSALAPFARDILNVMPAFLTMLMFLSGVFYDVNSFPQAQADILKLNPLAFILSEYRQVILNKSAIDFYGCAFFLALFVFLNSVLIAVFYKVSPFYTRALNE